MSSSKIEDKLIETLDKYFQNFGNKVYQNNFDDTDVLMNAFGITQELKSENKQYWGRELGKCWENILRDLFEVTCLDFQPPKRFGNDEPADFFCSKDAIDTKYRVASGDSGTHKKFEQYGNLLKKNGYNPIFLILRTDNLQTALNKMRVGNWKIYTGEETFDYIKTKTNFDLKQWLIKLEKAGTYKIQR